MERLPLVEHVNEFAPLINATIVGSACFLGRWVWKSLVNKGKVLRLAATATSILLFAAAAYAVKGLF